MCGGLTLVVRRLNKNAYKIKETFRKATPPQREGGYLLMRKKADETKKAEPLSKFSLFLF